MKASLPFKYITAVKGGKHYVVFDYKDNEGKRKSVCGRHGAPLREIIRFGFPSADVDDFREFFGVSGNL